eukprot:363203-Chlamydomonas_euryale.AAC.21
MHAQLMTGMNAMGLLKPRKWMTHRDEILSRCGIPCRLALQFGHIPFVSQMAGFKVEDTRAYQKGQAFVDDLKEKYETSDHPMVHKVEEYKERVFSGSEASQAMHEIRTRDPGFDMNVFLRSIKLDAPVVTQAFLKHDMGQLSDHCGPEIMQRLEGLCSALKQQELYEDPTILFVGDVEVVEVRMMDGDPFVICQFHCQQLKCVRDKFGNVVEGSPDTIHRVYYFWGLQQEKEGTVTADGELLPPRWAIKDMLWQSMLALV